MSKRNRIHLLLGIVFLVGCGQKTTHPPPSPDDKNGTLRFQVGIGESEDVESSHLRFEITAVYENQKPSEENPFHVDGGDWTFFECQAVKDSNVVFTVGAKSGKASGGFPIAWGKAMLIVKDKIAGGRFLSLFGRSFLGRVPPTKDRPYEPQPLMINTAVLGENLHRDAHGGFSGEQGGWTATKWFPEFDGRSGEIFFNYNFAERRGEFSEKDAEYADDLLAVFSGALRDGPRPERTPENDPNLTRIGPKIGPPRKLLSRYTSHSSFGPKDRFAVYQAGSTIFALPLDVPNGEPFEIAKFDHSPWTVQVLNEDLDLLVQEGIPEKPGVKSSADPMRIWWVESKGKKKTLLRGPKKNLDLAEAPVSPDLRYIGLEQWQGKPGTDARSKVLFILDRTSGTEKSFRLQGEALSLVDWKEMEGGVQAVAVTNRWRFDEKESMSYLADPATGKLEHQKDIDAFYDLDNVLSPDGKHRVRVSEKELIVTDVASDEQRRFLFHEDDVPFVGDECIEWVTPRYLMFNGQRLALIDVTTLKMCFPPSTDGAKFSSHSYKFSSDLRWVLYQGEGIEGEGLYLAPVEIPEEG